MNDDIEYSHGLLKEKFIERDNKAIHAINNRNFGFGGQPNIEERLLFVEDRLTDICSVVCKLLDELQKEKHSLKKASEK
jgi:hypothetical protein